MAQRDADEWASSKVACAAPPWGSRQSHGLVACRGALVLVGGFSGEKGSSNDVWTSTNGGKVEGGYLARGYTQKTTTPDC
jgi:hypothetical protein